MPKMLKILAVIVVLEFVAAFALGSWLRDRLEGPRFYLGSAPAHPLHVGHARPPVLEPGQHEQEVG